MPPVSKHKARSHQDSLKIVCAACWRKKKTVSNISEKMADLTRKFVFDGYNKTNGYHPTVLCDGCRKTLSDLDKVKYEGS